MPIPLSPTNNSPNTVHVDQGTVNGRARGKHIVEIIRQEVGELGGGKRRGQQGNIAGIGQGDHLGHHLVVVCDHHAGNFKLKNGFEGFALLILLETRQIQHLRVAHHLNPVKRKKPEKARECETGPMHIARRERIADPALPCDEGQRELVAVLFDQLANRNLWHGVCLTLSP